MLQRTLPAGFIAPCLPSKADQLPSGSGWLHEIKHDGFRVIARKNGAQMRLYSRPGNDLTYRFPLMVETLARLRSSCHRCPAPESPFCLMTGKNRIMIYGPKIDGPTSSSLGRPRARRWRSRYRGRRDCGDSAFSGANALWVVRAGHN
jgi:hypothetical protein